MHTVLRMAAKERRERKEDKSNALVLLVFYCGYLYLLAASLRLRPTAINASASPIAPCNGIGT